jgi:hypothetical protein
LRSCKIDAPKRPQKFASDQGPGVLGVLAKPIEAGYPATKVKRRVRQARVIVDGFRRSLITGASRGILVNSD